VSSKKKTTTRKEAAKSKNATTKEKTSSKSKTKPVSQKDKVKLDELKGKLESLSEILKKTAEALPSLVSSTGTQTKTNSSMLSRFETDVELIGMLEEFFERLVILLRLRSKYDQKLNQIYRHIKKLQDANSLGEFRGIMQLLGIALVEIEYITEDYKEIYTNLFTEQALLQFQLMEQLLLFRDRYIPGFTELFEKGLDTFNKINEKLDK